MSVHMQKVTETLLQFKTSPRISNVPRKHLLSLELDSAKSFDPCILSDICFVSNSSDCVHRQNNLKQKINLEWNCAEKRPSARLAQNEAEQLKVLLPDFHKMPAVSLTLKMHRYV